MKTAVVNFKTTPEIKKRAMKNAKKAGTSLSFLLDRHLREIADEEQNFAYLEAKLASDAKDLAQLAFNDLPTEDEWVAIQPAIN